MVEMVQKPDGVLLPIHAQARARKNAIVGVHAGRLKVAVTQAPERGKANGAILKLLAKQLGLRASQLQLAAGQTSPQKMVFIEGVTVEELGACLNRILDR